MHTHHPNRFTITAITRPESPYTPPPGSQITHLTADYTSLASLTTAFSSQDCIINCLTGSATQYAPSKLIIDAAVATGVEFYFANEFVGYVTSPQFRRLPEAAVGAKVRIREYLQELSEKGRLDWISLNGGPFFDMWLMKGPAGFDIKNKKVRMYGTGENPLFWTPLPTMARAVVNILLQYSTEKEVKNRAVYIAPIPQISQKRILETVERVLGKKFEVENVDVQRINENAKIALERGEVGKAVKGLALSNQFYEGDAGNDFSAEVTNGAVGVEEMSVEEAVRDAIERYGRDCEVVEGMFRIEACEV